MKNLNDDLRQAYKELSWRGIVGMRSITAHKYQTLKIGGVWTTLQKHIPGVKTQLLDIIND